MCGGRTDAKDNIFFPRITWLLPWTGLSLLRFATGGGSLTVKAPAGTALARGVGVDDLPPPPAAAAATLSSPSPSPSPSLSSDEDEDDDP
jgi:hypothetical protein